MSEAPGFGPSGGSAARGEEPSNRTILEVRNLTKHFPVTSGVLAQRVVGVIKAVDDVSFAVCEGETLGLVGESGCGKTTTVRCILQLEKPTGGEVLFEGRDLTRMDERDLRAVRRRIQVIPQDPYGSLNPRMTVRQTVAEPLTVHGLAASRAEASTQAAELLAMVGLSGTLADRYPHEISGGQRQRVGIARALTLKPRFILFDEPVSALDVSIQAQILNLLEDLQQEFSLTYLLVAHDLSVVRHISDRVAVMYLGRIVEIADRRALYEEPLHPYTKALLAAVPIPDPTVEATRERTVLKGEVPSPLHPPAGCVFHPRCPIAVAECSQGVPPLREVRPGHWAACIRA
jgi:oligopeptide transport system ATP-binding protein